MHTTGQVEFLENLPPRKDFSKTSILRGRGAAATIRERTWAQFETVKRQDFSDLRCQSAHEKGSFQDSPIRTAAVWMMPIRLHPFVKFSLCSLKVSSVFFSSSSALCILLFSSIPALLHSFRPHSKFYLCLHVSIHPFLLLCPCQTLPALPRSWTVQLLHRCPRDICPPPPGSSLLLAIPQSVCPNSPSRMMMHSRMAIRAPVLRPADDRKASPWHIRILPWRWHGHTRSVSVLVPLNDGSPLSHTTMGSSYSSWVRWLKRLRLAMMLAVLSAMENKNKIFGKTSLVVLGYSPPVLLLLCAKIPCFIPRLRLINFKGVHLDSLQKNILASAEGLLMELVT